MSFLEPFFLVGLLGAAVPLIIHLINRKKAVRVQFPAISFLLQSQKKVARGSRLRQWLLLALRMLAVALLAMALAKPFFLSQSGVTQDERLPTATVFVVDTSYSMATDGVWSRVESSLNNEISRLRPWDEVALITTGGEIVWDVLSADHGALKKAAARLVPSHHANTLVDAVLDASDLLNPSMLPNKRIVVLTDMAKGAMEVGPLPEIPWHVEFLGPRADKAPQSLSLVDVVYTQEGSRRERLWRIDATVRNHGPADVASQAIQLVVEGDVVAGGKMDIKAGRSSVFTFRHRLEVDAAQSARVELVKADKLAVDDVRWFTLQSGDRVRVLLVNGEPSSIAYRDELFFLERALASSREADSGVIVSVTTREGLESRELNDVDVLVLANLSHVGAETARRLEEYVQKGGGLLMTVGTQVDVNAWNQNFAKLLPKPVRSHKQLAEYGDPDAPVKITRFGVSKVDHGIFQAFDAPGGGTLQSAQVYSYMLLEPSPPDENTSLLLSFKDGAPALLEREFGAGRVLLFTTTVDMDWSDLPTRTAYLPLTRRMVQYLARRVTSEGRASHVAGEWVELDVQGLGVERLILRGSDETRWVEVPDEQGRVRFKPTLAGIYSAYINDETVNGRAPLLDFAVNVDTRESDLTPLDASVFAIWSAEGDESMGSREERRVNLWPLLLFAFTMFLLVESVLGTRRSVLLRIWRIITRQPQEPDATQV